MNQTTTTANTSFNIALPDSVFIPRMFTNITSERVTKVFDNLGLGEVSHVDFVPRSDGNESKMAFVHFKSWNIENIACQHLIERIYDSERDARVVYEDPYYWLLFPNHNSSSSQKYTNYNIHRQLSNIQRNMNAIDCRVRNMTNVLDTLLSDFYEVPQQLPSSDSDFVSVTKNIYCKVCSVALNPKQTQCPACNAPVDSDVELFNVLTSQPDDFSEQSIQNHSEAAMNKINDFIDLQQESKEKENENENKSEKSTSYWNTHWF